MMSSEPDNPSIRSDNVELGLDADSLASNCVTAASGNVRLVLGRVTAASGHDSLESSNVKMGPDTAAFQSSRGALRSIHAKLVSRHDKPGSAFAIPLPASQTSPVM